MKLFFEKLGRGKPLFILHGFLGMSDNWHSIGRELSEKFCVYLIDARNHGRSPHSDNFGFEAMVNDLLELIEQEEISKLSVIGHSMGGKTAMLLACKYPELVEKLVIVDINPVGEIQDDEPLRLLKIMSVFDAASYKTYQDLEVSLKSRIKSERLRAFVLKNIKRTADGSFSWKLNVPALLANSKEIKWPLEHGLVFGGSALLIKGELSNYLPISELPMLRQHFPNCEFLEIKGAGHWVHADKPAEFLSAVIDFL